MSEQSTSLKRILAEHGFRVTAARSVILETLVAHGGHLSADDLVELVHEEQPHVGRMTVYRTLDLLCELGAARPVYQGTGAAHFVLLEDGHHHHLVCTECGRVFDFDDCVLGRLQTELSERYGFTVEGHLLEVYGRCRTCQE